MEFWYDRYLEKNRSQLSNRVILTQHENEGVTLILYGKVNPSPPPLYGPGN